MANRFNLYEDTFNDIIKDGNVLRPFAPRGDGYEPSYIEEDVQLEDVLESSDEMIDHQQGYDVTKRGTKRSFHQLYDGYSDSNLNVEEKEGDVTINKNLSPNKGIVSKKKKIILDPNPFNLQNRSSLKKFEKNQNIEYIAKKFKSKSNNTITPNPANPSGSSNANTNTTPNVPTSTQWMPYSISPDIEVFKKYGIDPKKHDLQCEDCFGCNIQSDSIPLKESNVKILIEKINQTAVTSGSPLKRAERIHEYYVELIEKPKSKLHSLLDNISNTEQSKHDHFHLNYKNNDNRDDIESTTSSPSHSMITTKHQQQQRQLQLLKKQMGEREEEPDTSQYLCTDWNVLDIYVHITRHQKNVIDQVQMRRDALWEIMSTMERGGLFKCHMTQKDEYNNPLAVSDPTELKNYLLANDKWLALSKSRPDLMRPFCDFDRTNLMSNGQNGGKGIIKSGSNANGGGGGGGGVSGGMLNISGRLLFNKKPSPLTKK